MKKIVGLLVCVVVVVACGWLIFGDNDLLDVELPFAFPAGNLAAAVMMVAMAAMPMLLAQPGSKLRFVARWLLVATVLWLPVSMALAGGMQLSYSGWQSWVWMIYTLLLLLAIPVVLVWAVAAAFLAARKGAGT